MTDQNPTNSPVTSNSPAAPNSQNGPAPSKAAPKPDTVEASFVFVDSLKQPIEGLSVRLLASTATSEPTWQQGTPTHAGPIPIQADSTPSANAVSATGASGVPAAPASPASAPTTPATTQQNSIEATTDATGYAITIRNAMRGEAIDVLVKKRNGQYEKKLTVVPKKDFNAYTVASPEYHFSATTKLTPKDEMEIDLHIPVVNDGEVMTVERLLREFVPFLTAAEKVTEEGMVIKDYPIKKKIVDPDSKPDKKGHKKAKTMIEHHYKAVKTGKPTTYSLNVLPSRISYPSPAEFSDEQFRAVAKALDCEVAVIRAIALTESGGEPYEINGLPKVLFERNHFWNFTKPAPDKHGKTPPHPYAQYSDICSINSGGYKGGLAEWVRLLRAAQLDLENALKSTSFGGFQVLGEYYVQLGYASAAAFVDDFMAGTDKQMVILQNFFKTVKKGALPYLKTRNWEKITAYYNGGDWQEHNPDYPQNMADNYAASVAAGKNK